MANQNPTSANRRLAALIGLLFGLAVFFVVALIFSLIGLSSFGLVAGALLAVAWVAYGWFAGQNLILDLCDVEPADDEVRLNNVTIGQCAGAGVTVPALYVTDDPGLNAMAVGRDSRHASLVFTRGLLNELSVIELEAVVALLLHKVKTSAIAPEMIVIPTFGAGPVLSELTDRVEWLSRLLALPMPIFESVMGRVHTSRSEIDVDIAAVTSTRYPPALAAALEKMSGRSALSIAPPVTAHLWIAPPLGISARPALANAHAPLSERISVLHEL